RVVTEMTAPALVSSPDLGSLGRASVPPALRCLLRAIAVLGLLALWGCQCARAGKELPGANLEATGTRGPARASSSGVAGAALSPLPEVPLTERSLSPDRLYNREAPIPPQCYTKTEG